MNELQLAQDELESRIRRVRARAESFLLNEKKEPERADEVAPRSATLVRLGQTCGVR